MMLPIMINGTMGAKTAGKRPVDKENIEGTKTTKSAPRMPRKAQAIKNTALTIVPVINCSFNKGAKVTIVKNAENLTKSENNVLFKVRDLIFSIFLFAKINFLFLFKIFCVANFMPNYR